jgi:SAM-dependent methyltransferase
LGGYRAAAVDVNRRYFLHYVRAVAPPGARVLDYGCGDGTMVRVLRRAGYDAYGVDIRWAGADYGDLEATELGRAGVLRYFDEGGPLPFPDGSFDVVISDQVLEHVVPLEAAVRELERVTRGVSYHHVPSRGVWREAHIGVPFAHRLPPGRARLAYVTAARRLGLGNFKDERPPREWAAQMLDWIDRWTVYRTSRELEAAFGRVAHREIDYCRFRAADRPWLRAVLDRPRARRPVEALFRRLAFDAIEWRRG